MSNADLRALLAEELARGLFNCLSRDRYLTEKEHDRIVAAFREYGAAVRARDAEICRRSGRPVGAGDGDTYVPGTSTDCAAAISREPLP